MFVILGLEIIKRQLVMLFGSACKRRNPCWNIMYSVSVAVTDKKQWTRISVAAIDWTKTWFHCTAGNRIQAPRAQHEENNVREHSATLPCKVD